MRNKSTLDDTLAKHQADGYLFDAADDSSDQYYLFEFTAPDPFISVYTPDKMALLVSGLEYGRAKQESNADAVYRYSDFEYRQRVTDHGEIVGRNLMIGDFLDTVGVDSVMVPKRFPTATTDGLREQDIAVTVDHDETITGIRAQKTETEIEHIAAAQRANEAAMQRAEELITTATIKDGTLYHDGSPLTSEHVKQEIEIQLLRENCALDDTIVACGADGADPHNRGSGPLSANEPIVVDIFPKNKETNYHADMTRTFIRGDVSSELQHRYDVTKEAHQTALNLLEPGITGAEVHDAVCDVYEEAGFATLRSDDSTETGFIHGTGHGVGLDVHERPSVNLTGEELKPGHVITIEPGVYDPDIGGIRIEDLVAITGDGYRNLTEYQKEFHIGKP
ncbi:Xaa-Pro peptidase family protein [Salinarchaeum sp. IM2453]|uniref:M24 family metallopeptidase n=1 Tax=Salinarchaeum sp. IM2453 TaxID=2862870 RepID=UPI001C836008|nr:Xaa-Pro peptidase family protein [Salinarchaeum sp. IM2453]QZA88587.1 Xaa-Pro peptidase family protein [Salinarchaeum sp. IM2453]